MRERFLEITGKLAEHFGMPLEGAEPPGFLVYEPGAFFSAHTDTGADVPPDIRRRRVSAVLFLEWSVCIVFRRRRLRGRLSQVSWGA